MFIMTHPDMSSSSEVLLDHELLKEVPEAVQRGIGHIALRGFSDTDPGEPLELRPHQVEAWNALHAHRMAGKNKGLVHMATGLGKTIVVAGDIATFAQEREANGEKAPRVLFLAHQVELIKQARSEYATLLPEMDSVEISGRTKAKITEDKNLVFSTIQSMATHLKDLEPDYFDYVVVDESHHSMAREYRKVIAHFQPQYRLGVTATPFRRDEQDLGVLFGETVYAKNLVSAISGKLLDSPQYEIVSDEILDRAIENNFNSMHELEEVMFDEARNTEIARIITDKQSDIIHPKTIIFARDIAHAEDFASYIPGAKALHSDLPRKEREAIMAEFRSGELATIVTVDMYNEGVNIPNANLAVFLRSTSSRAIFEQQLGRILRKMPNKHSHVLDFVGTAERLQMLYDLSEEVRVLNEEKLLDDYSEYEEGYLDYDRYGTFNPHFTKRELDIIEKLRDMTLVTEHAPEGWLSLGEVAELVDRSLGVIYTTVRGLDVSPERFIGTNEHILLHLSPEDVEKVINHFAVEPGWMSVAELSEATGMSDSYISAYIVKNNIEARRIPTDRMKHFALHISPEDAEKFYVEHKAKEAPEDWVSIADLANEFNVTRLSMRRAFKRLNLHTEMYMSRVGRQVSYHVSEEDAVKVREFFNGDGWVALVELGREIGRSSQTIKKFLKGQNVPIRQILNGTSGKMIPVDHIQEEYKDMVREFFKTDEASDEWERLSTMAPELGVTFSALRAMAKKMRAEVRQYESHNNSKVTPFVRKEFAEVLRAHYNGKKKVSNPSTPDL
jgi:superfamily II DNA or RNA helicase